jgi:shikimate dehydrogenase
VTGQEPRSYLSGLLGQGVRPSLTPELHEREAQRHWLRYVYKTVDLAERRTAPEQLRELLHYAIELGFDGLNVTHPVKQAMVPLVDRVSSEVEAIGALNTVVIRDGGTAGHNTDVTGFGTAFRAGLPDASLESVVLLGAGGAGTAVGHALAGLGARHLVVHDPDASRAERLVASVRRLDKALMVEVVTQSGLAGAVTTASGVVNATPVGMAAHPGTPLPPDLLTPSLWVADIVYRPLLTELLSEATARGCRTLNGAGMAVHQAADAFELFTGRPAHRDAMLRDFDQMVAAEVALGTPRERNQ